MSDAVDEASTTDKLGRGAVALWRGAWQDAQGLYAAAVGEADSPQALEGLGQAQWWLGDTEAATVARQRAYCGYRCAGEVVGAARMAVVLAVQCLSQRHAPEAARGWLRRAERLLEGTEVSPHHAWVALWQAQLAIAHGGDDDAAGYSARAGEVARLVGSVALESLAGAQRRLALVMGGGVVGAVESVSDQHLAAMAGARQDLELVASATSQLMYCWEQVKDFDSIERWATLLDAVGAPWSSSWAWWGCRVQHSAALMWRGAWDQVEHDLVAAIDAMRPTRVDIAAEAMVRLARLRRRQGHDAEAESLLDQASCGPLRPGCEAQGLLAMAELHLDRGEAAPARAAVEQVLDATRHAHCVTKVAPLALAVAAEAACGKADLVHHALGELQRSACAVANDGVRATVRLAEGTVAICMGEFDLAVARLEEAVASFERCGAGFETAQARLELAVALAGAGRQQPAMRQAAAALEHLTTLGACREAERGQARLPAQHSPTAAPARRSASGLTSRELELLRLVAAGLDNNSIAEQLTLSVRTVERHLSNIYEKLQASGRSARATAVSYVLRQGLLSERS